MLIVIRLYKNPSATEGFFHVTEYYVTHNSMFLPPKRVFQANPVARTTMAVIMRMLPVTR